MEGYVRKVRIRGYIIKDGLRGGEVYNNGAELEKEEGSARIS